MRARDEWVRCGEVLSWVDGKRYDPLMVFGTSLKATKQKPARTVRTLASCSDKKFMSYCYCCRFACKIHNFIRKWSLAPPSCKQTVASHWGWWENKARTRPPPSPKYTGTTFGKIVLPGACENHIYVNSIWALIKLSSDKGFKCFYSCNFPWIPYHIHSSLFYCCLLVRQTKGRWRMVVSV